tara:strand:+ start:1078 stop:1305 length:228 start_codon:yes stop_codon:yes gene_type:complete
LEKLGRIIIIKLQRGAALKNKDLDSYTHDHEIGMDKPIECRDFLQDAAFSLATDRDYLSESGTEVNGTLGKHVNS